MNKINRSYYALSLIILCLNCASSFAQSASYESSLVAHWAGDTAAIENFTIVGNTLKGEALHLYPEPHLRSFEFSYALDGTISKLIMNFLTIDDSPQKLNSKSGFLPYSIEGIQLEDTIVFTVLNSEGETRFKHPSRGTVFMGGWIPIMGQWEYQIKNAESLPIITEDGFVNYVIGTYDLFFREEKKDKVIFESEISKPITIQTDDEGYITEINAIGSPWNYQVYSSPHPLKLDDYHDQFSAKPTIGDPSPHEVVTNLVDGITVNIDYGRPSCRGRKIFGNVVPYGKRWRTGAGPPTTITFDQYLQFNDQIIPPGTYNLFTIPMKDSWKLIFNDEPNAWGSAPREAFDVATLIMAAGMSTEHVEQFTISLTEQDQMLKMKMAWSNTVATVQIKPVTYLQEGALIGIHVADRKDTISREDAHHFFNKSYIPAWRNLIPGSRVHHLNGEIESLFDKDIFCWIFKDQSTRDQYWKAKDTPTAIYANLRKSIDSLYTDQTFYKHHNGWINSLSNDYVVVLADSDCHNIDLLAKENTMSLRPFSVKENTGEDQLISFARTTWLPALSEASNNAPTYLLKGARGSHQDSYAILQVNPKDQQSPQSIKALKLADQWIGEWINGKFRLIVQ